MKRILPLLFLSILVICCEKNNVVEFYDLSGKEQPVQTMSCKINGVEWEADTFNAYIWHGILDIYCKIVEDDETIEHINFTITSDTSGQLPTGSIPPHIIKYNYETKKRYGSFIEHFDSCELYVSQIDYSDSTISGTFYATLKDYDSEETIKLTEGKFDNIFFRTLPD